MKHEFIDIPILHLFFTQDVYANFPPWLYPTAHAQSRLAAATSAAAAFYPGYAGTAADYGAGEVVGGRLVAGGLGGRVQHPCTCHERLYGSVRGTGFKPCKSCRSLHLRSQYRAQFAALPAPPVPPHPTHPTPHAKNASAFRSDPYEYMRKARIGNGGNGVNGRNGDNNNVDDWQSCWVDEAVDARD